MPPIWASPTCWAPEASEAIENVEPAGFRFVTVHWAWACGAMPAKPMSAAMPPRNLCDMLLSFRCRSVRESARDRHLPRTSGVQNTRLHAPHVKGIPRIGVAASDARTAEWISSRCRRRP